MSFGPKIFRRASNASRPVGLFCALTALIIASHAVATETTFPIRENSWVGDSACFECHREKSETYRDSAHAKASSRPSIATIKGHFEAGKNELRTSNPNLHYVMQATDGSFTQTAWFKSSPTTMLDRSEVLGVVIGAGRKGQTYSYWDDNKLFQLPVSYWTEVDCWINSPGYPDGTPYFERTTPPRCLECHATAFEWQPPIENQYRKASLVLGLTCEKCHGPGGNHVAMFRSQAARTPARMDLAIVNPAKLSRDRHIDVCALCHGGAGNSLTPPLSFKPGDVLSNHLTLPRQKSDARLDVHASQVQLLKQSRCFQASQTMSCSTCHDVHKSQRSPESFDVKCMTCHQPEKCGMIAKMGRAFERGCVACHMPEEKTEQIVFNAITEKIQPKVRNHRIAVYSNAPDR